MSEPLWIGNIRIKRRSLIYADLRLSIIPMVVITLIEAENFKFQSAHIEYRDQAFNINDTFHTKVRSSVQIKNEIWNKKHKKQIFI